MRFDRFFRPALAAVAAALVLAPAAVAKWTYPQTRRIDHVDVYHGVSVADPYRWLEDDVRESKPVAEWVEAENEVTFGYLEKLPGRSAIEERLTELWNYEKIEGVFKAGGRYFMERNDGLQNQSVLYTMDSLDGEPRVLLDPNTWSEDGTVALAGFAVSDDGRYLAYGVADGGSDWRTWRVLSIEDGQQLPDELRWLKFTNAAWTPDGRGFFYGRYDAPKEGAEYQELNLNQKIYYHRVGTPQSEDVLVYRRPDHPDWGFFPEVTEDGRYLVITIWKGTDARYRIAYRDLSEPYGMMTDLIEDFEQEYSLVGSNGPVLYFQTDLEAPRRRVIAIDLRKPGREHWKEVLPQSEDTLIAAGLVGNLFIGRYLQDARSAVRIFTEDGKPVREVELPGIGSARGFSGRRADTETFYEFSSFATPPSVYRYDLITGESRLIKRAEVDFDPAKYEVKQVFYESKDGTRVPMFIAHRKGIQLDGGNATLLYGYGGFDIPMTPSFSVSRLAWLEMGGVFAMANLRCGGEYGEPWHKAGT